MRFAGRTVIVTGASSGIGRATAEAFAAEGARVALAARRGGRLDEVAAGIRDRGGEVLVVPTDVTDPAAITALVDATIGKWGRIDIIVNNAGVGMGGTIEQMDLERFEQIFRVNVLGPLLLIRAALPHLRRQSGGVICNVSSVIGVRALPGTGGYCATKFALNALSESLRAELRGTGIEVVLAMPTVTETEFFAASQLGAAITLPPEERPEWMKHAQTSEQAAAELLDAVARKKYFAPFSTRGRMLVFMQRHAPWFLDRVMLR